MDEKDFTIKYLEFNNQIRGLINATELPMIVKSNILKQIVSSMDATISMKLKEQTGEKVEKQVEKDDKANEELSPN